MNLDLIVTKFVPVQYNSTSDEGVKTSAQVVLKGAGDESVKWNLTCTGDTEDVQAFLDSIGLRGAGDKVRIQFKVVQTQSKLAEHLSAPLSPEDEDEDEDDQDWDEDEDAEPEPEPHVIAGVPTRPIADVEALTSWDVLQYIKNRYTGRSTSPIERSPDTIYTFTDLQVPELKALLSHLGQGGISGLKKADLQNQVIKILREYIWSELRRPLLQNADPILEGLDAPPADGF